MAHKSGATGQSVTAHNREINIEREYEDNCATKMRSSAARTSTFVLVPLTCAAILIGERPAQAVLTYYIYEQGNNVVIETSGSLNMPISPSYTGFSCGVDGYIRSNLAQICTTGITPSLYGYTISGPTSFGTGGGTFANSASGLNTALLGSSSYIMLHPSYVRNSNIVSNVTFNNKTLAGLGITTTGLLGTWTLAGTGDTIQVRAGTSPSPSGAGVPGPLPLLGAATAFAHSRRLRRRVSQASSAASLNGTISA